MKKQQWIGRGAPIAVAALASLALRTAGAPAEGRQAAEIGTPGTTWINYIGQSPDLAALRGQALLLEFWATW